MFRTVVRSNLAQRGVHTVPKLPFDASVGIPGIYSADGFRIAWTEYQGLMTEKLSRSTVETSNYTRYPYHIVLNSARVARQAHVFNYASQAFNNHLFFSVLRKADVPANEPSPALQKRIVESFGSLEELKAEILAAADSILDQGYVFLVERPDKSLGLVASNGTGTPYTYGRTQENDMNATLSEDQTAELRGVQEKVAGNTINNDIALLCLNLWQHAYVPDFGVSGRAKFIEAWWNAIDWQLVSSRLYRHE